MTGKHLKPTRNKSMFEIISIARIGAEDITDFVLFGKIYRLIARPIKGCKYLHWSRKHPSFSFFVQTHWLTLFSK
jgi:hypothetical protein